MNKNVRLFGILLVLSLLVLPMGGCMDSAMSLVLKVDKPEDGSTVNTPTVTVSGSVKGSESQGAKVRVNGADVPVQDQKFSTDVTLKEGKNVIEIVAASGQAMPQETVTVSYVPSK